MVCRNYMGVKEISNKQQMDKKVLNQTSKLKLKFEISRYKVMPAKGQQRPANGSSTVVDIPLETATRAK